MSVMANEATTSETFASKLLLSVDGVTVDFDGFKALNGFSLTLDYGSLRILIGPNGAGKSTLCDTIIGRVRATSGHVLFKGEDITHLPEYEIVQRGICRKFQTPGVLVGLSVFHDLHCLDSIRKAVWAGGPMAHRGRGDQAPGEEEKNAHEHDMNHVSYMHKMLLK